MSVSAFLFIYVLGGLTLIPLVLATVLLHAYITLPVKEEGSSSADECARDTPDRDSNQLDTAFESLPEELKTRTHVPDVAAGYFAVCREYVPGGINGKPPERTTPAGGVVAAESPSVYQSMYRSIFDRNKTMSPTLDGTNKSKKGRNVFYVVLRLGILMLYDDSEQLEVRHVISLAHYDVDIYSGGEAIPEGELWIKRNCIRLTQRSHLDKSVSDSKPFYLFSENCSEKEDFYHAMLQSQDHRTDTPRSPPRPLKFDTPDLVRLVQQLHASEENMHTRWINALVGRVFLAMYKTDQVEKFIWTKITKKISRVPKPALISKINLVKVDMGTLPPFITNPKLRELTVDGDLTVEADVSYKGNFRVEISAIARIELGSRFKAREVTLVLGVTLKKLEGHVLLRIKPPPSNRLWVTFESAPKMELSVEPIVSSRQITYGVILRAIESRLREVVSETLVLPNWDDIPFKDTEVSPFRGGIWTEDAKKSQVNTSLPTLTEQDVASGDKGSDSEDADTLVNTLTSTDDSKSTRTADSAVDSLDAQSTAMSSATDIKLINKPKAMRSGSFAGAVSAVVDINASATKSELRERHHDATAAMKTISSKSQPTSPAETPVGSPSQPSPIKEAGRRSTSPEDPEADRGQDFNIGTSQLDSAATLPSTSSDSGESPNLGSAFSPTKSRHGSSLSLPRNAFGSADKRQMFNQSLNTATAAAKKWFAARQNADSLASPNPLTGASSPRDQAPALRRQQSNDSAHSHSSKETLATLQPPTSAGEPNAPLGSPSNPIGRGQLIPENAMGAQKEKEKSKASGWSVQSSFTRRKPVPQPSSQFQPSPNIPSEEKPPPLPARHQEQPSTPQFSNHQRRTSVGTAAMGRKKSSSIPSIHSVQSNHAQPLHSPARRQRKSTIENTASTSNSSLGLGVNGSGEDGLFVIEAPKDGSTPTSPVKVEHQPDKKTEGATRGSVGSVPEETMVFGMEAEDGVT